MGACALRCVMRAWYDPEGLEWLPRLWWVWRPARFTLAYVTLLTLYSPFFETHSWLLLVWPLLHHWQQHTASLDCGSGVVYNLPANLLKGSTASDMRLFLRQLCSVQLEGGQMQKLVFFFCSMMVNQMKIYMCMYIFCKSRLLLVIDTLQLIL